MKGENGAENRTWISTDMPKKKKNGCKAKLSGFLPADGSVAIVICIIYMKPENLPIFMIKMGWSWRTAYETEGNI